MSDCPHTGAPYVKGSDTSQAAAVSVAPHLPRLEAVVLLSVAKSGGRTSDEVEVETGLPHQTVSARIRGLVQRGLLADSGARRPTRSGRGAAVWVPVVAEKQGALAL